MQNPLLEKNPLPLFSQLKPEHIQPALNEILINNRAAVQQLLTRQTGYTWQNLIEPLDTIDDTLDTAWALVEHLVAVVGTKVLRKAHRACLPKITEYLTEMGQNVPLYEAIQSIAISPVFQELNAIQKRVINNVLRDFRLAGVGLTATAKERFKTVQKQLAKLATRFEENVLDATQAWTQSVSDVTTLAGLPPHALAAAHEAAKQKRQSGWLLTLNMPFYSAVITHADNRSLRAEIYHAHVTRASDEAI